MHSPVQSQSIIEVPISHQKDIPCSNYFSALSDLPEDFQFHQMQSGQQCPHQQQNIPQHVQKQKHKTVHVTRGKQVTLKTEIKDDSTATELPLISPTNTITHIQPSLHIEHLWHRRMGHISKTVLTRIIESGGVTGLPNIDILSMYNAPCYECLA